MDANGGWVTQDDIALLTDLYELKMLQSYWWYGMGERAVFSLTFRELPDNRNFMLACGQNEVVSHIEKLHFTDEQLQALKEQGAFKDEFISWLKDFRFTGDIYTVPEGTPVFPHEPILEVEAPIGEAQLLESFVMNQIHLQTLLASKAVRCVQAAKGRAVVDFGMRRMHGADAAMRGVRAYWIAGMAATSNVLGGFRYGVPTSGTMAHSYIQAYDEEVRALADFARLYPGTTLLIDTYDSLECVRQVTELAQRPEFSGLIGGVRLDSGDLGELAVASRRLLDEAGLQDAKIIASGSLSEYGIAELIEQGAPIDGFGVGTNVGCSKDSPLVDLVYKLTEYAGEGRTKRSPGKHILPGRKQVYRQFKDGVLARDLITGRDERADGTPLLRPVMNNGQMTGPEEDLDIRRAREYCRKQVESLPEALRSPKTCDWREEVEVSISDGLRHYERDVLGRIGYQQD